MKMLALYALVEDENTIIESFAYIAGIKYKVQTCHYLTCEKSSGATVVAVYAAAEDSIHRRGGGRWYNANIIKCYSY